MDRNIILTFLVCPIIAMFITGLALIGYSVYGIATAMLEAKIIFSFLSGALMALYSVIIADALTK